MKNRILKLLSLILCLGMIFALCGCSTLDKMKASTGYYQDKNTVLFDGKTYKLVPYCKYLSAWNAKSIHLAQKDVPLLIANISSGGNYVNENKTAIFGNWKHEEQEIFVRIDLYKDIVERIESENFFDTLAYTYYGRGVAYENLENLNPEDAGTLNNIILESANSPIDAIPDESVYYANIKSASNDQLFTKELGSFYALYDENGPTSFSYSSLNGDNEVYYSVPQNYTETLINLFGELK